MLESDSIIHGIAIEGSFIDPELGSDNFIKEDSDQSTFSDYYIALKIQKGNTW